MKNVDYEKGIGIGKLLKIKLIGFFDRESHFQYQARSAYIYPRYEFIFNS